MSAMKTTLDIPDAHYREFKAKTASGLSARRRNAKSKLPEWAGIAEPFITKYPDDPLDSEKMRDDIVAARRAGLRCKQTCKRRACGF